MSTANLQPNPIKKIKPDNKKTRMGFMTLAVRDGIEIPIFHPTLLGLEIAFNTITDGRTPFSVGFVTRVQVIKEKEGL